MPENRFESDLAEGAGTPGLRDDKTLDDHIADPEGRARYDRLAAEGGRGQTGSAQTIEPIVKDHPAPGEPVEIPEHLAQQFADTTVVKHESGQLVANIPADRGGWWRVIVAAGHGIDRLAHEVSAFRERQQRGA